ncbi:translation protein [Fomitopsis serialis]|uniref:translation protein n=1 Tax=Fomitopsis serialis TaxID=139415 RepID=UPI002007A0C3|nr:translation protein [Neoantrodia serialis]KAH9930703.1 translation protein [Neoantrodia serialis]
MHRLWALAQRPRLPCRTLHSTTVKSAAPAAEASSSTAAAKWTPTSVRTGVIARKRGMLVMWDDHGARFPVTVLQLDNCQVTANVETVRKDDSEYHAVQVAASDRREKTTTRQMLGHFKNAGVPPITPDAHVPVGTTLSAIHFVPGQLVDVVANSYDWQGFPGHNEAVELQGLRASHGVSASHRAAGAIGAHQDPAVLAWQEDGWPYGKQAKDHSNLAVVRVDSELDLIFVRGCVPGVDDAHVMVRDAKKKMVQTAQHEYAKGNMEKILPRELAAQLPPVIEAPTLRRSPFVPQS